MRQLKTTRGYALLEVASALQKAVRRGDARLAGYWAIELFESGYREYTWRRLLTISAEDCWGVITHEVEALFRSWQFIDRQKKGGGRVFVAKAAILLSQAAKCRDADHLTNLVYDKNAVDSQQVEADLAEARKATESIPEYAFDCHTMQGKRAGRTKAEFFVEEHDALAPRVPGLFDQDLEDLRKEVKP
jgi:replication-associated recombination protein RarA